MFVFVFPTVWKMGIPQIPWTKLLRLYKKRYKEIVRLLQEVVLFQGLRGCITFARGTRGNV